MCKMHKLTFVLIKQWSFCTLGLNLNIVWDEGISALLCLLGCADVYCCNKHSVVMSHLDSGIDSSFLMPARQGINSVWD